LVDKNWGISFDFFDRKVHNLGKTIFTATVNMICVNFDVNQEAERGEKEKEGFQGGYGENIGVGRPH